MISIQPEPLLPPSPSPSPSPSPMTATESSVSSPLPQSPPAPLPPAHPCEFIPFEALETEWLGDQGRLRSILADGAAADDGARYAPGTLVWVMLSKGKPKHPKRAQSSGYQASALHKRRRDKKSGRNVDQCQRSTGNQEHAAGGEDAGPEIAAAGRRASARRDAAAADADRGKSTLNKSRKELFLRARVVADDAEEPPPGAPATRSHASRRVLVRYARGSTYRVRAYNLMPVLEGNVAAADGTAPPVLVVLAPETNIYRRVAKVHATPDDAFVEIGCDYGITVDKVRSSMEEAGDVPKAWPVEEGAGADISEKKAQGRVSCLGVDKSKESIDIATQRYPRCKFLREDILLRMSSLRASCERLLAGAAPSVVGIDINGNRDVTDVRRCLRMVMDEPWARRPRLIIVKSRFLYWEWKERAREVEGRACLEVAADSFA